MGASSTATAKQDSIEDLADLRSELANLHAQACEVREEACRGAQAIACNTDQAVCAVYRQLEGTRMYCVERIEKGLVDFKEEVWARLDAHSSDLQSNQEDFRLEVWKLLDEREVQLGVLGIQLHRDMDDFKDVVCADLSGVGEVVAGMDGLVERVGSVEQSLATSRNDVEACEQVSRATWHTCSEDIVSLRSEFERQVADAVKVDEKINSAVRGLWPRIDDLEVAINERLNSALKLAGGEACKGDIAALAGRVDILDEELSGVIVKLKVAENEGRPGRLAKGLGDPGEAPRGGPASCSALRDEGKGPSATSGRHRVPISGESKVAKHQAAERMLKDLAAQGCSPAELSEARKMVSRTLQPSRSCS